MAITAGTQLGSYEVLSLLGKGGMGEVYRADDLKLGQPVSLKFLPESLAAQPGMREAPQFAVGGREQGVGIGGGRRRLHAGGWRLRSPACRTRPSGCP